MSNLIDSHVSLKQTKLAVEALLKHSEKVQAERDETELLGAKDELVWLNVNVKQVHPEKKLKPFSMCAPYSLNFVYLTPMLTL
jgi:ribosome biogenesis protein UTP30